MTGARPQILLVPSWTEVQWAIRPELEEWADVASYDPPGVGAEPPPEGPLPEAIVARGATQDPAFLEAVRAALRGRPSAS